MLKEVKKYFDKAINEVGTSHAMISLFFIYFAIIQAITCFIAPSVGNIVALVIQLIVVVIELSSYNKSKTIS